ncbi:MAG: CDGSH iron-sulfur domain-containing protein [Nitrososphaerales archaeon]
MAKVVIKASENGPYIVEVDGKTVAALCRCGGSNKKPNCDGTHKKAGFKAPAAEVKVIE